MSDHAHAAHVAHQFDSAEQQHQSAMFGMWIFLLTEIMFFGAVFVAYAIYRGQFTDAFALGSNLLDLRKGSVNTVLLMTSSFTMTLSVLAARANNKAGIKTWLMVTILLGVVFLGLKATEYQAKFAHHLVPGEHFHFDPEHATVGHSGAGAEAVAKLAETVDTSKLQMYFSFYFTMTGLHAIHMIIGIGILIFILRMAQKGKFSSAYYNPVAVTSLYWHFVDMVWIFLFPMLYLLGRHG